MTVGEHNGMFECRATSRGHTEQLILMVDVLARNDFVPPPLIQREDDGPKAVKIGDTFTLKCSVTLDTAVDTIILLAMICRFYRLLLRRFVWS